MKYMDTERAILPTTSYINDAYMPLDVGADKMETNVIIALDYRGLNLREKGMKRALILHNSVRIFYIAFLFKCTKTIVQINSCYSNGQSRSAKKKTFRHCFSCARSPVKLRKN